MEIRAAKKKELEKIFELRTNIFKSCSIRYFRNKVIYDPYFNLNNTRLVLDHKNHILSNAQIHPRFIKYGKDVLLCGVIGDVCTPEKFQHHKYADYVLDDAISYMWLNKFDFSILFGSIDFYLRFGWEPLNLKRMSFEDIKAPILKNEYLTKEASEDEKRRCFKIYKHNKFANTGSVIRNKKHWKNLPKWQEGWIQDNLFIIASKKNKIVAYLRGKLKEGMLNIFEFCSIKEDSEDVIKEMIKYMIENEHIKKISFSFENDEIANYFIEYSKKYDINGGYILTRIIDFSSFINKVQYTLKERIKNSKKYIPEFKLFFITPSGEVFIKIRNNKLYLYRRKEDYAKYLTFNHENLIKLLFGKYDTIKSLAISGYKYLDKEQIKVLEILFPKQEFTFWQTDDL